MKGLFGQDTLQFMMDIRFNNNKEFMSSHRQEYVSKLRKPYYDLIETLAPTMRKIDPEMEVRPVKALSRIFRDTRFSRDKSPYRDHHWVAFRRQGEPREQAVMFWFEIRLDAASWGLGFWGENRPAMEIFRRRILANPSELIDLLPVLREHQFQLDGASYHRLKPPEGLHGQLHEWYNRKEIYLSKMNINPEWVFQEDLTDRLVSDFTALAPFYHLLRGCYVLGQLNDQNPGFV